MNKVTLSKVAKVELSSIDKKFVSTEKPVKLCNFIDVYYNWAITKDVIDSCMDGSVKTSEFQKFVLKKGQVAITKDSETRDDIGIPCYISDDFNNAVLGYHCALITPKSSELSGKYLNALLHTTYARKCFSHQAGGSGQRFTLTKDAIENIVILLPQLDEQKRIGKFFSDIDKKIQNNKKQIQILEKLAQTIYDYWFVQFDFPNEEGKPYKSNKGKMVWNDILKRSIPEKWQVVPLNNWLNIKSGFPFDSDTYKKVGKYKIITIKNVQDGVLVTTGCDYVDEIPPKAKDYVSLKIGDRLISLTGNCGRLCVVSETNLLLNQRVGLLDCSEDMLEYTYQLLKSPYMKKKAEYLANGAAQANLSPIDLCNIYAILPPKDVIYAFNDIVANIRSKIIKCTQEITNLTSLREDLLPLLINGQVTINS